MINAQDVQDVIDVQGIIAVNTAERDLIVALINWKHGNGVVTLAPTPAPAKAAATKGKAPDDEAF